MTMIDPATEDWTLKSDSAVYWAATDGIPPAIAEYERRGLDQPS